MKIQLKVMGDMLHGLMAKALKSEHALQATSVSKEAPDWQLIETMRTFVATDWVCQQAVPTLLLIDADDTALLRSFQASQGALHHLINSTRHPAIVRCPVILVFNSATALAQWSHLPDFACDWMLVSGLNEEAVPRILSALRKANVLPLTQNHAALTLVPPRER